MLSISRELIVSRYVAESITTDAGRFGHVGRCQLRTKLTLHFAICCDYTTSSPLFPHNHVKCTALDTVSTNV